MKKITTITLLLLLSFNFNSCLLLNETGLSPGRETGDVAAQRIQDAAIMMDIILSNAFTRQSRVSVFSLVADKIQGINKSGFYKTADVDKCVEQINGVPGFLIGSLFANLFLCDLVEDDDLWDP